MKPHSLPVVSRVSGVALAFVAGLVLSFLAPAGTAAAQTLQPGDELILIIPGMTPAERTVGLDNEGKVNLGTYGQVRLAGLTVAEATRTLRRHLGKYLTGTAGIQLVVKEEKRLVLVSGQVQKPGFVRVGKSDDMWQAIQLAGGVLGGADLMNVVLTRLGQDQKVDLRAYLTRERSTPLPDLQGGDVIFVPADSASPVGQGSKGAFLGQKALENKVFVIGSVNAPGLYDRSPGLTVLMAIGLAGGPAPTADLVSVRVLTPEKGESVDVSAQIAGKASMSPIPVGSGAIVYVPGGGSADINPLGRHVSVMGGVARPSRMSVGSPMRLVDAIGAAGGPSKDGDLSEVQVVKIGEGFTLATEYNVEKYLSKGGVVGMVTVDAGDTVYVDQASRVWESVTRLISDLAVLSSAIALFVRLGP